MFARDLRAGARDALRGHWGTAIAVALVGSLLGGGIDLVSNASGASINLDTMEIETTQVGLLNFISRDVWAMLVTITIVTALLALVIGGAVTLGMVTFNLNLLNRREARFSDLFSQFHRLGQAVLLRVLRWLIQMAPLAVVALMTPLLLVELVNLAAFAAIIVIGIFGSYLGYGLEMLEFIMAERDTCRAVDALKQSWNLMKGNRWRLFCLEFSFIGWAILTALTLGIGSLWLVPYMQTAYASFYRELNPRTVRTWAVNDACGDDGRFLGGYPELP